MKKAWRRRREGDKGESLLPSSPDTDLFWEIPGRSCCLSRARWRLRRSPRPSWPRLWLVGSRCSPPCYLPMILTAMEEGGRRDMTFIFTNSLIISPHFFPYFFPHICSGLSCKFKYLLSLILHTLPVASEMIQFFRRLMKILSIFSPFFFFTWCFNYEAVFPL